MMRLRNFSILAVLALVGCGGGKDRNKGKDTPELAGPGVVPPAEMKDAPKKEPQAPNIPDKK
jgi:hypothetical protein